MSFVSSRGSWSSGFSGFGLSRPSSGAAEPSVRPPVVGSTRGDGSKAAASNKSTVVTRGPGLNVVPVNVGVKQAIPVDGPVAVSKLAHQLIDAYGKGLASISVDVNKIRGAKDMLGTLAGKWEAQEPNLAATMLQLANHDSFDDSIRLNIDIQYGVSEQVQSPKSGSVSHDFVELERQTKCLHPQGEFVADLKGKDFANDRLDLASGVSRRIEQPIEINLDSNFGRGLQNVLNFIGEVYEAPRTETEWTAFGQRLEERFVSRECQNRPEIWEAAQSLRQLSLDDPTNSPISEAFLAGFMTENTLAIVDSQPKPSASAKPSDKTLPPESAVAASGFLYQDPVIRLAEGSQLRNVVVELLSLVDDHQPEGRTATQWHELGVLVGQKFIEGPRVKYDIFRGVNTLRDFESRGVEDPNILGSLLFGFFSFDGVMNEYDRMDLSAGPLGTSTPHSFHTANDIVDSNSRVRSATVSSLSMDEMALQSDLDQNHDSSPSSRVGGDVSVVPTPPTQLKVFRQMETRKDILGKSAPNSDSHHDSLFTSPISLRNLSGGRVADKNDGMRLSERFSVTSNPPFSLPVVSTPGEPVSRSLGNLPNQDASFGRIYEQVPELFASERSAVEPFFELGLNVRDALARYDHQIDGLGSRSSGIEGNDSGEHGEISGRNSQLRAAVEELRKAPQTEHTRSFFAGFDSAIQGRSVTVSSFFVGQNGTDLSDQMALQSDWYPTHKSGPPSPLNSSPGSSRSTSPGARLILGPTERQSFFVDEDDSQSETEFWWECLRSSELDLAVTRRRLVDEFRPADGEDRRLPGTNSGMAVSAADGSQTGEERGSQVNPFGGVKTEGRNLIDFKGGVDSDAESEDRGFGYGLGRNTSASGNGGTIAGSAGTIPPKKTGRSVWTRIYEYFSKPNKDPQDASQKSIEIELEIVKSPTDSPTDSSTVRSFPNKTS